MMRLLIAMMEHETNTFSPVPTPLERFGPLYGQAAIDAFFTAKGRDVYAILPRWPGRRFVVKDAAGLGAREASLVGGPSGLRLTPTGADLAVDLPELPADLVGQPLFVLKLAL